MLTTKYINYIEIYAECRDFGVFSTNYKLRNHKTVPGQNTSKNRLENRVNIKITICTMHDGTLKR